MGLVSGLLMETACYSIHKERGQVGGRQMPSVQVKPSEDKPMLASSEGPMWRGSVMALLSVALTTTGIN